MVLIEWQAHVCSQKCSFVCDHKCPPFTQMELHMQPQLPATCASGAMHMCTFTWHLHSVVPNGSWPSGWLRHGGGDPWTNVKKPESGIHYSCGNLTKLWLLHAILLLCSDYCLQSHDHNFHHHPATNKGQYL